MAGGIAGIVSDSGYVIYDDTPGKMANLEALRRFRSIDLAELTRLFLPYKERAQVDPGYAVDDALSDLARQLGVDPAAVLAARRTIRVERELREGVRETLVELLRRGVPFVILSDSHQTGAQMRLKYESELGLDHLVSDFVTSKDTGLRKPDPRMFRAAGERIAAALGGGELDSSRIAFLGHDLDELQGAHRAGLRPLAVYFHGRREEIPFIPEPDILTGFADLLRLLDAGERPPVSAGQIRV